MPPVLSFLGADPQTFSRLTLVSKEWHNIAWKKFPLLAPTYTRIYNYEKWYTTPPPSQIVVCRLLCNIYFDPGAELLDNFKTACFFGHTGFVKYLIDRVPLDPSLEEQWGIRFAATNGRADTVQYLLGFSSVDPSAHSNFALHGASANGHIGTNYSPSPVSSNTRA